MYQTISSQPFFEYTFSFYHVPHFNNNIIIESERSLMWLKSVNKFLCNKMMFENISFMQQPKKSTQEIASTKESRVKYFRYINQTCTPPPQSESHFQLSNLLLLTADA